MVYGPMEGNVAETPSLDNTSTKLHRIATLAREIQDGPLRTLAHHIDVEFLCEAFRRTRKDGAPGVDGRTARRYEENLEVNLQDLLDRAKSGSYRAPPVRRVEIPKGDGRSTRPIGIPTIEDKILQRAVTMILEAIYEGDFESFSYGFRPGRSAHQALNALADGTMKMYGGWVVEVDIQGFFDNLEHHHLRDILSKRVGDGVILRLVGKWLNAGVTKGREVSYPVKGTPQGGVISPLLANIYLDEVVDKWWVHTIEPRLYGRAVMVRYADDMVMVFERKRDAERMVKALPKRFARYGLAVHPEKTRMLPFEPPDKRTPGRRGGPPTAPGSFDFLGFTLHWRRTQKGKWGVGRKTASSRVRRTLTRLNQWLKKHRHLPVPAQRKKLCAALQGHYAYFGVTGNARTLHRVFDRVTKMWRKWLSRRSGGPEMSWEKFRRILDRHPLPSPRIVHSIYRRANP